MTFSSQETGSPTEPTEENRRSTFVVHLFSTCCGRLRTRPENPASVLLCRFAKQNDKQAFAELLKRSQDRMVRIAGNWCREWELPSYWAQDIVQMSLLKIVQKANRYDCDRDAQPWLDTILKNTFVDFSRREGKRRCKSLSDRDTNDGRDDSSRSEPIDPRCYRPEEASLFRERNTLLERAVCRLPEIERALFLLRRGGVSNREVAATFEIGESTATEHFKRAVTLLREQLR